jgi:hypothetical protein
LDVDGRARSVVGWMIWVCVVGIIMVGCFRVVWCMEVISVGGLYGVVGYLFIVGRFARYVSILRASSSSSCLISIASSLSFVA